ncbi:hypothetical protein [Campylobacter canadensis]|uniref:Glycosyltransferase RgtA/B/C/D-like domain-containing protein n=1 Tax=Campylobacter canadensis TaxID=449520 RepID=A0ABS7WRW0_9BACT|nr:hypothetical protein [Campylobacter canadensis]MBZ7987479.1 hypothetical protein [Campylobacter canadensis]MBZ7994822.1 hypothetical protein [Campylobacter canadensis]MBZ7996393.1 hypothetical protein [Campylobacter canadensis]MBZ7998427.1 hypothetical protein [Campylobacter canadensis]MBZ8000141.1 hypothetical protein [Campylobacter canadensis]
MKKICVILFFDICILLWQNAFLSLSIYEINEINFNSAFSILLQYLLSILGSEYIRVFFIFLHILSCILLYLISKKYLEQRAYIALIIFILCPGVLASSLLINYAGLVIFISLLLIYLEQKKQNLIFYIILSLSIYFIPSMMIFAFALLIYSYNKRKKNLFYYCLFLFFLSLNKYGFDVSGRPRAYFFDMLAICATVFTPPLFLYYFYTIYDIAFKRKKDLLFFVSASSFLLCLALSFRQKTQIEDFLPFLIIAIPLVVKEFISSFYVHLPEFRLKYKIMLYFTLFSLVFSYLFVLFNPILYRYIDKSEHFARAYHLNKELAKSLKENNINEISKNSDNFAILQFYGLKECKEKVCKRIYLCKNSNIKINFFFNTFYFCEKKEYN